MEIHLIGVAHHHARGVETVGGNAFEAPRGEKRAHLVAQFLLRVTDFLEPVGAGLVHGIAERPQRVGRHGGVISVPVVFVGAHDVQPFAQIAREARAARLSDTIAGKCAQHDEPGTR